MSEGPTGFGLMEGAPPEAQLPEVGLWPWFALAGGLVALALAGVMLGVVLRKRRLARDPQAARKAAWREASARLEAARPGDPREAAVLASLTLRKYLSLAAGDPALFETQEEFTGREGALAGVPEAARGEAVAWFAQLARLKYAPGGCDADAAAVLAGSRRVLDILHGGLGP